MPHQKSIFSPPHGVNRCIKIISVTFWTGVKKVFNVFSEYELVNQEGTKLNKTWIVLVMFVVYSREMKDLTRRAWSVCWGSLGVWKASLIFSSTWNVERSSTHSRIWTHVHSTKSFTTTLYVQQISLQCVTFGTYQPNWWRWGKFTNAW